MLKVALVSTAHVHTPSYARCLGAIEGVEAVGLWDDDPERSEAASERFGVPAYAELEALLDLSDAAIVCSENLKHGTHMAAVVERGLPVLCEKPLSATHEDSALIERLIESGARVMTAFPCPFSPVFARLLAIARSGDLGRLVAVNATNRGTCPFGWFVEPALSGGGALVDHSVHVADLLWRLSGQEPLRVDATTGTQMIRGKAEDTAHMTLHYADGTFATIDASWSRPQGYWTWGDVTLAAMFEKGVVESDLFGQGPREHGRKSTLRGTASDLDMLMVGEFVQGCIEERAFAVTGEDGLRASRVFLYANVVRV